MSQSQPPPRISSLPPARQNPTNWAEVAESLSELARSQDMIFEKLEEIHAAVKISANEALEVSHLKTRVDRLEHEVALLKGNGYSHDTDST